MDTEDLAINDSSKNEKIKNLTASLPNTSITILLDAFLIEAVDLGDLARLMVTTDESDLTRVSMTR